jgi:hypothetical protein
MMKQSSNDEIGHWTFYGNFPSYFDTQNYIGFIYSIENKATNQFYIGKKQMKYGGKKRSPKYNKEMPWRTYTGSSVHLNKAIKEIGKGDFEFLIIDLYKTKGGLYYAEAYTQMILGVMTEKLPCGVLPRFYNAQIAAIRFTPKEELTTNTKKFIRNFKRRYR